MITTRAADTPPPILIEGASFVDDRGTLSFVNGFSFEGVRRFYVVDNFSPDVIRAFHGHMKEEKYVFVSEGTFIVAAVAMDDTSAPSKDTAVHRYIMDARKPAILRIPKGYANGFRALTPHNKIFFFSSATLEESKNDDFRFPADYWGSGVWEVEDR